MEDVELEYDEDDFSNLTNFKLFCDNIKPLVVADTSAKLSAGKLNKFLQAKYREFVMQVPPMERSNYDTAGVGKSSGIFIETGALLEILFVLGFYHCWQCLSVVPHYLLRVFVES